MRRSLPVYQVHVSHSYIAQILKPRHQKASVMDTVWLVQWCFRILEIARSLVACRAATTTLETMWIVPPSIAKAHRSANEEAARPPISFILRGRYLACRLQSSNKSVIVNSHQGPSYQNLGWIWDIHHWKSNWSKSFSAFPNCWDSS